MISNKWWNWQEKFRIVARAKKGENIFPLLEKEGISWWEFREWWLAHAAGGKDGLKQKRGKRVSHVN